MPVFFQTTRQKKGGDDPLAFFGTGRTDASTYGVSYVSVPRNREIGSIPHASIVKLDFSKDPSRHVIVKGLKTYSGSASFLKALQEQIGDSDRKEALIYIHGFNQTFQDAVEVAAIFASPDVESRDFESMVVKAQVQAKRMTLYTAASDIPLGLSETIRNGFFGASKLSRAGDAAGGVLSTTYLVDASKAQADWMGHSNFRQLAKDDLRGLLWLQTPASKRCVLLTQQPGWRYEPPTACSSEAFGMATLFQRRLKTRDAALQQLSGRSEPIARQATAILRAMAPPNTP